MQFKLERINEIILEPIPDHPWESGAVFNPGTIRIDDNIHMLYRAVEGNNRSAIGYARLDRSAKILSRIEHPVITPSLPEEQQGCEDPRIVRFRDRILIFYTGFDGADMKAGKNARVVLAETADFFNFKKYGVIGPDCQDKDAMIFPEEIGGKVAYLHRIEPDIQLAFFDSVEHLAGPEKSYWPAHMQSISGHKLLSRSYSWEAVKIGAGPPPMRIDAGWLLIYHGVDKDHVYRTGAALLDYKDPFRVIARLPYPILEPQREYEKFGDVNMVVFPEGMVRFDDDLLIFYGAADKVIGLAACSVSKLIDALWENRC
jgi:predicted GH43/DUF377 family glycosyl hydrolase